MLDTIAASCVVYDVRSQSDIYKFNFPERRKCTAFRGTYPVTFKIVVDDQNRYEDDKEAIDGLQKNTMARFQDR